MKVDNAVIMAAGTASRFVPLSYEKPKALVEVRGEILIERQIKQLREVGINEIIIVTGYKAEQFDYLVEKYGVILINNPYYLFRNNNSSIYVVKEYLRNSYICSSDNYFLVNPFENEIDESFYSSVFMDGETKEWCIEEKDGWIQDVKIGGRNSWIMLGHVFWSESFSRRFIEILEVEYNNSETVNKLWETIYIEHIKELPMRIKKYDPNTLFEFDTLEELKKFDLSYQMDTRSKILKDISRKLGVEENQIVGIVEIKDENNAASGFSFEVNGNKYQYYYTNNNTKRIK